MTETGRMLLEEGIEKLNNIAIKIFDIASLEELRTYFE